MKPAPLSLVDGNSMLRGGLTERPIDPDNYCQCSECGDQTHVDLAAPVPDRKIMCAFCYSKTEHGFNCEACERDFVHIGVPTHCLYCGSRRVTSGYTIIDEWIKEAQVEEADRILSQHTRIGNLVEFAIQQYRFH